MVIVNDEYLKIEQEIQLIKDLIIGLNMNEYKLCYLKSSVDEFLDKYPFYMISKTILQNYENLDNNKDEEKVLFAYSQFLQQLQENKLFLGSNLNANSRKQLDAFKNKDNNRFQDYECNVKVSERKIEKYKYINYPISEIGESLIDFFLKSQIQLIHKTVLFYYAVQQDQQNIDRMVIRLQVLQQQDI